MSKYVVNDTTLIGIGDAIRTKKGTSAQIPVPNLASEILSIPSGGGMPSWIVSGEMTPQDNIESFTVTHNKGVKPICALIYCDDSSFAGYQHLISFNSQYISANGVSQYCTNTGIPNNMTLAYGGAEITDESVRFFSRGGNYLFKMGFLYKYFLFFEEA